MYFDDTRCCLIAGVISSIPCESHVVFHRTSQVVVNIQAFKSARVVGDIEICPTYCFIGRHINVVLTVSELWLRVICKHDNIRTYLFRIAQVSTACIQIFTADFFFSGGLIQTA